MVKKERLTNRNFEVVTRRRLMFESFINCIPTLIGFLLWGTMIWLGVVWIQSTFINDMIYPLLIIVWFVVIALPMTRIIPAPSLIYQEVSE
jgi:hypothetical protein